MTDTPMRKTRKELGLSVRQVAEAVGTDPSNLSRIETGHHAPPRPLAREIYRFYAGDVSIVDIYDPTFMDQVGIVEKAENSWYQVRTRVREYRAHGLKGLTALFDKLAAGAQPAD